MKGWFEENLVKKMKTLVDVSSKDSSLGLRRRALTGYSATALISSISCSHVSKCGNLNDLFHTANKNKTRPASPRYRRGNTKTPGGQIERPVAEIVTPCPTSMGIIMIRDPGLGAAVVGAEPRKPLRKELLGLDFPVYRCSSVVVL